MKKEIKEILSILESNNYQALVVGGYVRNKLLGKESSDIDITTNALVKDMVLLFKNYTKRVDEYGSLKLSVNNSIIDITTFRKEDDYINNKPTKIDYIDDLYTDLLRRDFTINTICMDKDERIIDYLDAVNDLNNGMIYTVGDVNIKFKEDKTRILRAIRFMVTLNFTLSEDILCYIINNKKDLEEISFSKKKEEIDKMFLSKNYLKFISFIKQYDLEKYLGIKINKLIKTPSIIGYWAQIEYNEKYPFTRLEKEQIQNIRKLVDKKKIDKYDIYVYGSYISMIASSILGKNPNKINNIYMNFSIHSIKDIDITVDEIFNILSVENKTIGIVLKRLEKDIINGKIKNNKKNIINYLCKRKNDYE